MPAAVNQLISWEKMEGLARDAMVAANDVRFELDMDLEESICAYSACETLGVIVRFVDVDMEGMYMQEGNGRAFLSSRRPFGRRHFTCAHELGHHIFGHGTTLDEIRNEQDEYLFRPPNEILADAFAGHFLMPVIGIRNAIARRDIDINKITPKEIYIIATEFGVSYGALLAHLTFAVKDITTNQRKELMKARKGFRDLFQSKVSGAEVIALDQYFITPNIDIEENHIIAAPKGTVIEGNVIELIGEDAYGCIFQAKEKGMETVEIPGMLKPLNIRVASNRFVGLAQYRHLEDEE